jgi:hypothetical protein
LGTFGHGERDAATARAARLSTFPPGGLRRRLVDAFLAPQARLLIIEGSAEGAQVRVAHEALLTH